MTGFRNFACCTPFKTNIRENKPVTEYRFTVIALVYIKISKLKLQRLQKLTPKKVWAYVKKTSSAIGNKPVG